MNLLALKDEILRIKHDLSKSDKVFVLCGQFDTYIKTGASVKILAQLLAKESICIDFAIKEGKLWYHGEEIWTLENDFANFQELQYIRKIGDTYLIYIVDHYQSSDYTDFGAAKTKNIMLLFRDGKVTKL